ncbi:FAD binding domain-containing protein [Leptodontidium sp. MPI-SDFR-AT-0119]|nr:FAD binding domain-containing protein [Leptodontidium sp. MPI-SDFR-AT-0119]
MAQLSVVNGLEHLDDTIDLSKPTSKDVELSNFDHSSIPLEKEEWPVVIMGSSLVGMMTGLLLGFHGIKTISFDRRPTFLSHPRATGLNFRTCEILRQLGLEKRCREESVREFDVDAGLLVVERLVKGKLLATVQEHDPKRDQEVTPSEWLWLTQAMLEPILVEYAPMSNYNLVYGKEIVHYDEQPDGVIVVVRDLATNEHKKYKSQYLVACDGNRSAVRRKEGIDMKGVGHLGTGLNLRFKADLQKLLGDRARHGIIYVTMPHLKGAFRQEERGKAGLLWINEADGRIDFPPGSVSEDEARKMLYEFSGLSGEAGIELQSFAHWTLASCTAERYSSKGGRVLIAGDAAHIMPPTGALGGNTGCNDAHNLAWKLAYVLTGRAAPSLLQSYEQERRPNDAAVVDQATRRFRNRIQNQIPQLPEETYDVVEIGGRYNKGALVPGKGDSSDKDFEDPHSPSGTAGSRFPHVSLLSKDDQTISTLDLIKHNFVLVAAEEDSPWIAAAKGLEFQIDTYVLHETSQPYQDVKGLLRSRGKLAPGEALLVRPDNYIAWRATVQGSNHKEALQQALGQLLGKPTK